MMNLPAHPLDLLFVADQGVDLIGERVRRWRPMRGHAFMEQVEASARPKLVLSGTQHCIQFDGKTHLCFRAFDVPKGPHTFVFVCRTKEGLLLDSQHAGPVVKAPSGHWQIYETVQDTYLPINGDTTLGSNYYGNGGFLKGEIAAFGYKQGILDRPQREYLYMLLNQKLGEAEKGFWSFHIPKPKWWRV